MRSMVQEEDAFLAFAESARLMLTNSQTQQHWKEGCEEEAVEVEEVMVPCQGAGSPSWGWVCSRILDCLNAYSSGVTPAILLSDLLKVFPFSLICTKIL